MREYREETDKKSEGIPWDKNSVCKVTDRTA
jgi:hypothetical protein